MTTKACKDGSAPKDALASQLSEARVSAESTERWQALARDQRCRRALVREMDTCWGCGAESRVCYEKDGIIAVSCARRQVKECLDWYEKRRYGVDKMEKRTVPHPCGWTLRF